MPKEVRYAPVGRCIYCGSDGGKDRLRNEHIIPYALWGNLVLPKSSCRQCAAITAAFEQFVMRRMYGILRIRNSAPTRHKKERPVNLPMSITENGIERTVNLPVAAGTSAVPFVIFRPPGFLRDPPVSNCEGEQLTIKLRFLFPDPKYSIPLRPNMEGPSIPVVVNSRPLSQMLAKIAHSYCVAVFGVESFEHWLPPIILGHNVNALYLVGGLPPDLPPPPELNPSHDGFQLKVGLQEFHGKELLVAYIWYFAASGNAPNCIVVGSATDNFPR